jgi:hypothetical protein
MMSGSTLTFSHDINGGPEFWFRGVNIKMLNNIINEINK